MNDPMTDLGIWGAVGAAVWRTAPAIGNMLKAVPQLPGILSVALSERMAEHTKRQGAAEAVTAAFREVLVGEAKALVDHRADLRKRAAAASDPAERIRLRHELEATEADLQRVHVVGLAAQQPSRSISPALPAPIVSTREEASASHTEAGSESPTISDAWLDQFSEIASRRQELWRQNLIAKCLRLEAERPGSITLRLLWTVGTLEHRQFQAFSKFSAATIAVRDAADDEAHLCVLGETYDSGRGAVHPDLNSATWLCGDAGLVTDAAYEVQPHGTFTLEHGGKTTTVLVGEQIVTFGGHWVTPSGRELLLLCDTLEPSEHAQRNHEHAMAIAKAAGAAIG